MARHDVATDAERRAVAREDGQRPVKPEKARPRICVLCGWTAKAGDRALIDCGGESICSECITPGEQNRARLDPGRELRHQARLGQGGPGE
jgi:hypothetical protein